MVFEGTDELVKVVIALASGGAIGAVLSSNHERAERFRERKMDAAQQFLTRFDEAETALDAYQAATAQAVVAATALSEFSLAPRSDEETDFDTPLEATETAEGRSIPTELTDLGVEDHSGGPDPSQIEEAASKVAEAADAVTDEPDFPAEVIDAATFIANYSATGLTGAAHAPISHEDVEQFAAAARTTLATLTPHAFGPHAHLVSQLTASIRLMSRLVGSQQRQGESFIEQRAAFQALRATIPMLFITFARTADGSHPVGDAAERALSHLFAASVRIGDLFAEDHGSFGDEEFAESRREAIIALAEMTEAVSSEVRRRWRH